MTTMLSMLERIDRNLENARSEYRDLLAAFGPLEQNEFEPEDLDHFEARIRYFRLAAKMLFEAADNFKDVADIKIGQLYAEMPLPEE